MPDREAHLPLRVLIADQSAERLAVLATIVRGPGHEVVAAETDVSKVAQVTLTSHPDVALVALGESEEHALALITEIVAEAACPVIAVAPDYEASFAYQAARRGIYAYVVDTDVSGLENALQIVLLRFRAYHGLEGAFGRRAMIEQAKGIVMERHGIDQAAAFNSLRQHARSHNQTMVEVATSVIEGKLVLEPHDRA
jgi:response regulator NasT